jgi:hypothetical protein
MTTTRRAVLAGGGLLTSAAFLGDIPKTAAQPVEAGSAPEPSAAPLETAVEAYIYGYPLVTMEMTRRVMTNAEKAGAFTPRWGSLRTCIRTSRRRHCSARAVYVASPQGAKFSCRGRRARSTDRRWLGLR